MLSHKLRFFNLALFTFSVNVYFNYLIRILLMNIIHNCFYVFVTYCVEGKRFLYDIFLDRKYFAFIISVVHLSIPNENYQTKIFKFSRYMQTTAYKNCFVRFQTVFLKCSNLRIILIE